MLLLVMVVVVVVMVVVVRCCCLDGTRSTATSENGTDIGLPALLPGREVPDPAVDALTSLVVGRDGLD